MRAVFSGLSTVILFLWVVFWLGDEWMWLLDFLLQLFLFCLLGKIVLVPAFYLGVLLKDWRIVLFGLSLMVSVFIRWMIVLLFDFRIGKTFPVVEYGYGIPYSLACAFAFYLVLWNIPFVREVLRWEE